MANTPSQHRESRTHLRIRLGMESRCDLSRYLICGQQQRIRRQVGVASRGRRTGVPEDLSENGLAHPAAGRGAGKRMPQVMKPHIVEPNGGPNFSKSFNP